MVVVVVVVVAAVVAVVSFSVPLSGRSALPENTPGMNV
jgi:hypothetical protein